jgi:hypothetical protein
MTTETVVPTIEREREPLGRTVVAIGGSAGIEIDGGQRLVAARTAG